MEILIFEMESRTFSFKRSTNIVFYFLFVTPNVDLSY